MPTAVRTQIQITKCVECPFYERGAASMLADAFLKRTTRSGACKFHAGAQAFPLGRTPIENEEDLPASCPLRAGEVIIGLSAGASR